MNNTKTTAARRNRNRNLATNLQTFIDLILDPPISEDGFSFDPVLENIESDHLALMEVADQIA